MNKILTVSNLCKKYHTKDSEIIAFNDISFYLNKGEILSIVGPSGCGKSTILSILSNLINKSSGNIDVKNDYSIAYMLQDDCLLEHLTILDNCLIGLDIKHKLNKENKDYVISLLKKYDLINFKDSYPSNLSGGMRQRVALIRTLATRPDVLLLDEATSALDYQIKLSITEDIYNIIKNEGKTAIMVTHDLEQAISISDRIIVFSKRPAQIKNIYNLNLLKNISIKEKRKNKYFFNYYDSIWEDLEDE